jgi:hypothetical protein
MTSIQNKSQQTRTSRYIQHCILKIKVFCDVLSEAQVCDPFYFRKNRLPNRPKFTILIPQPTSWTFDLQSAVSSAVEHHPDTVGVTGSKPVSRIICKKL